VVCVRHVTSSNKKMIKVFDPKLSSLFFICSTTFHRSWIVFSDSLYQKLPRKPFRNATSRSYVRFPNFHVSYPTSKNCYTIHSMPSGIANEIKIQTLNSISLIKEVNYYAEKLERENSEYQEQMKQKQKAMDSK